MFLALWLAIALRRRRAARIARVAKAGGSAWKPRLPLAAIVTLAALAAGVPLVVWSVARSLEFVVGRSGWPSGGDVMFYALLGAIPSGLTSAWAVLVVLLVDQWSSPRAVRAAASGLLAAVLVAVPALVLAAGLEFGGEVTALGMVSGVAAGTVVFLSERKAAASPAPDVAATTPANG